LHGKQLITVENLRRRDGTIHPIQQMMVEQFGSQCGFCTPGIVMSLFALTMTTPDPSREQIVDALVGNLCRCTGYRPIIDAAGLAARRSYAGRPEWKSDGTIEQLRSIPRGPLLLDDGSEVYFRPATLGEALEFIGKHPDATILGGATDAALRVTKRHERIPKLIDLSGIQQLTSITESSAGMTVGAAAPLNALIARCGGRFPALRSMLKTFGSHQIRNQATLGGNLGTASPVGDCAPLLMAYGARVVLHGPRGDRSLPVDEFIVGYRKTARQPDELITAVFLPTPRSTSIVKWYKVSRRHDVDIAAVSAGFSLRLDSIGRVESFVLGFGGMADHTRRALAVEDYLCGKPWMREVVEKALPLIDSQFAPISDVRGSAKFRRVAARNLLMKFWRESADDEHTTGPNHDG
jgi:xanthine dehydrogenase small subunit